MTINLKVKSLPYWILSGESTSGLYPLNTKPGISTPITNETLRTRVNNCVTPPLFYAENQFADIFAWQFNMNGLPIPAIICPIITQLKLWLTNTLNPTPIIANVQPNEIAILVP